MLYAETLHSKWIANKFLGINPGLFVGHRNVTPSYSSILFLFLGVYLSKYSDLLQMNPFEVGAAGDIIIFKVMKVSLWPSIKCV